MPLGNDLGAAQSNLGVGRGDEITDREQMIMSDLNSAIGDATRTENVGAKLAASELFRATLGSPHGNTGHSVPAPPEGAAQAAEQPHGEQMPTAADASAENTAAPRHMVPGVGNHPSVRPPQRDPYSQLGELIRANR